ncbi:MAG: hypothetical protein F8N37_21615 [Telmatospirillum sp.]|nr:hypothetical protein [Telmatospirillum sp.]
MGARRHFFRLVPMSPRLLIPLLLAAVLSLSGCIVGDGIAHAVKLAKDGLGGGKSPAAAAESAPAPAPAPVVRDEAPPPPPAAAPARSSVDVESLPPPPGH